MNKDDHYERTLFGRIKAALRVNHEDGSITARLTDPEGISVLRATVCRSHNLALGAAFCVDEGADSDVVRAGLYLGNARLYVGARSPGLRELLRGLGIGRSLTSCEVYRCDDGAVYGPQTTLRAHWMDRDDGAFNGKRDLYFNVTQALFGQWEGEDAVLEDREVDVGLPEATYRTRARLIERTVSLPRWPLKRYRRFVEFIDAAMIVPRRKSDSFQHAGCDGFVTVLGQTIEEGIGELVGRVLRDRKVYGGDAWADGPPPRVKWLDSHKVSLVNHDLSAPDLAIEQDLMHGDSIGGSGLGFEISRDGLTGGVLIAPRGMQVIVARGTRQIADFTSKAQRLYPGDVVRVGELAFTVHFAPIGPPPGASVRADEITDRAAREGWYAANPDIVAGAREGLVYDGNIWREPVGPTVAEEFGMVRSVVAEGLAELQSDLPVVSPSEEAEGEAAREYIDGVTLVQQWGDTPTNAIKRATE